MENLPNEREILEGMQRAGDRLVQFGYAESYMVNDATGRGNIVWTPAGSALKRELQKIFNALAKDKGQAGQIDFVTFVTMLIDM
jgi:transketolase C-terminal domain/subunit